MYHESSLKNLCTLSTQTQRTVIKHLQILEELNLLKKTNKGWYELVGNTRFKAITESSGIDAVCVNSKLSKKELRNIVKLAKIKLAAISLEKHIIKKNSIKYKKKCKKKSKNKDSNISEKISRTSLQGNEEAVSITIIPKAISKVINGYNHLSGFSTSSVRSVLLNSKKSGLIFYKRRFSIKKYNSDFLTISKDFKNKDCVFKNKKPSDSNLVLEFEQVGLINKDKSIYKKQNFESPLFLWRVGNAVAIATELSSKKIFNREILGKSFNEYKYKKQSKKYNKIKYYASKKVLSSEDIKEMNIHYLKVRSKLK